jgi:hypothetical protein
VHDSREDAWGREKDHRNANGDEANQVQELILEIDFYLYSHKWLYFKGFQICCKCFYKTSKACPGDVVQVHS